MSTKLNWINNLCLEGELSEGEVDLLLVCLLRLLGELVLGELSSDGSAQLGTQLQVGENSQEEREKDEW